VFVACWGNAIELVRRIPTRWTPQLVASFRCHPISVTIVPPVRGYLIGLHSQPAAPLFYRSAGELTAGLFYGQGGDWVLRYWCER
jgi:hypothetical protein